MKYVCILSVMMLMLGACSVPDKIVISQPKLVQVTVIESHTFGETIETTGWWNEPYSYTIYEVIETGERIKVDKERLGAVGDTFVIKEIELY
jgi:hypothetical protein